jgi:magnesium-transporting ATPase (P-type)
MIGSEVTAQQKADLVHEMRVYNNVQGFGEVLGVVSSPLDLMLVKNADITIGLNTKNKRTDLLQSVDLHMTDLYGLSYLMFKHGTICHRRIKKAYDLFVYRTALMDIFALTFFAVSDLTATAFIPYLWFSTFNLLITPFMFFVTGSVSQDFASNYMHRIYGEYRCNLVYSESFEPRILIGAFIDGLLFSSTYIQFYNYGGPLNIDHNSYVEFETLELYGIVILTTIVACR